MTTRRSFLQLTAGAALAGALPGCATRPQSENLAWSCAPAYADDEQAYDYIVIGSGAGGGPLAANLARAGYKVLMLEAGGDPAEGANGEENLHYRVPVFHALASEDPLLAWNYYVRHYSDAARQRRDSKFVEREGGVLYPRAGTLGGCTAHNAMITIYPHNSDWDYIARLTGDSSWKAENMRRYFERLERCQYSSRFSDPSNGARHGRDGWLTTEKPDPALLFKDAQLLNVVAKAAKEAVAAGLGKPPGWLRTRLDPNDWRAVQDGSEGLFLTPLATQRGRRRGTRDYLREVEAQCADRLKIRTHALASKILFDGDNRAVGVEYREGQSLYRADPRAAGADGVLRHAMARREVILAAGTFNSPQLLKLSGIGPRDELTRLGIPVRVELKGVGRNLQDRYEVGVVSRMREDLALLSNCSFDAQDRDDACLKEWRAGKGVYASNGAVVGVVKRSRPDLADPDLFVFGLPGYFKGYYPGYAKKVAYDKDYFTWAVLKAHTRNTAGSVTLRSADPRDVPQIDFRYFDEGNDGAEHDLAAVVNGVEFARSVNRRADRAIAGEEIPGPSGDTPEKLRQFVRNEAWGHHASCTNPMGPADDPQAVVDSNFRVYGTRNLRVVDASIFPRIPGFFIVTPIYMVSEKATDAILADAALTKRA